MEELDSFHLYDLSFFFLFLLFLLNEVGFFLTDLRSIDVLADKLTNPRLLNVSGVSNRLGIIIVICSQVQVVSRLSDVNRNRVVAHVVEQATSVPGVQHPVAEDDVVVLGEVKLGVSASEVVESPVVLRGYPVGFLAHSSVSFLVPGVWQEHVSHS